MTTKLPSIPGFDGDNTLSVLSAIKETLEVRTGVRGDTLDSGVTFRDLESMGYLQTRSGSGGSSIGNLSANVSVVLPLGSRSIRYDPASDLTTPPPPEHLTAVVVFDTIMLKWEVAKFANPSYFEIYKSFTNELGSAQIAGTSTSQFFVDVVGEDRVVYYWARTVSAANIRSAWNSSFGTEAKSGINPTTLVDKVSKQVLSSDLYKQLSIGIADSYDQTRASVSAITKEVTARGVAIAAETTARGAALTAEATARGAAITAEANTRQSADDSMASSITTITAAVGTNASGISAEASARATADSAVASQVTVLASTTGTNAAAIQVEQSTRTTADSAVASQVTVLASTTGTNAAAIQVEQSTRTTADSAVASQTSFLAAVTANSLAAIQAEQAVRTSENSASASSVTTLSATVGGHTSAIQQETTTRTSQTGDLFAQYSVKIDQNGYVSGFGLSSESVSGVTKSAMMIRADRFAVVNPAVSPISVTAFAYDAAYRQFALPSGHGLVVGDTVSFFDIAGFSGAHTVGTVASTYIRIHDASLPATATINAGTSKVSKAHAPFTVQDGNVYISNAIIKDASITDAQIGLLAVKNANIAFDLSAAKITAGFLSADRIEAKTIDASKIASGEIAATEVITVGGTGSSAALILSGSGEIISNGSGGDKARFYFGNVEIYKQVPNVGSVVYKALSRSEFGSAVNNVAVTIPGYFKTQPKILVSPSNLSLYQSSYANQDQSIQCVANSIVESSAGSMVWSFTPVATLNLAANTGSTVINYSSGSTSADTFTSGTYTTAANTTAVTPSISIASSKGNGASQYFYRTVRWRLEYYNGSSWVADSYTTVNLAGSTTASSTSTKSFSFPSSGTWQFRIYAEAYNTDGSLYGAVGYNYATDNVSRSDAQTLTLTGLNQSGTLTYSPSYSLPAGWEKTGQSFTYIYSWQGGANTNASASISGSGIYKFVGSNESNSQSNQSQTYTGGLTLSWNLAAGTLLYSATIRLDLHSMSGTVSRRQVQTNSATSANTFAVNSYNFSLSSAQVLATGSLNWIAIGE